MSQNPVTKSVESKLYFIVFVLFSVFMTMTIYNSSLDTMISADFYSDTPSVKTSRNQSAPSSTTTNIDSRELNYRAQ